MDKTTEKDALNILKKYGMDNLKIDLIETPKKGKYFENITNILLGSNQVALEEMKKRAEELGYDTYIEDTKLEGEARILGQKFVSVGYSPKSCHLWGGETTVKVLGKGEGGRNQEFVLGALPHIPYNTVVAACASDGWDNSDVAGAIADMGLYDKSLDIGLDTLLFLDNNDAYNFFKQSGGHIKTERTGSNVADFYLVIKGVEEAILEEE